MALKLIDDRDPAITFSSPPAGLSDWDRERFGGPLEYMSTTSLSRRKGATATFSFDGTAVSVYGTISTNVTVSAASSYAIDGGDPTFFQAPLVAQDVHQTPFFQSSTLSPGSHTLVIRNEADDDFYWFDFIAVSSSDGTGNLPASSSAGGLSSSSTSTVARTSSATPTPTPTSTTANHTAAIIGGSIGAAIVFALLAGVVVWRCMRRRHRRRKDDRWTIDPDPTYHNTNTDTESTTQSESHSSRPYTSNTSLTAFLADGSVPTTQVFSAKEASGPQGRRGTPYDPPPMYQYAT